MDSNTTDVQSELQALRQEVKTSKSLLQDMLEENARRRTDAKSRKPRALVEFSLNVHVEPSCVGNLFGQASLANQHVSFGESSPTETYETHASMEEVQRAMEASEERTAAAIQRLEAVFNDLQGRQISELTQLRSKEAKERQELMEQRDRLLAQVSELEQESNVRPTVALSEKIEGEEFLHNVDFRRFLSGLPPPPPNQPDRDTAPRVYNVACRSQAELNEVLAPSPVEFLYFPGRMIWSSRNAIAFGVLRTITKDNRGSEDTSFLELNGKTRELFFVKDDHVKYAGTFKCHSIRPLFPHGVKLPQELDATAMARVFLKSQHIKNNDLQYITTMYAQGVLNVNCLVLQYVGFNFAFYDDACRKAATHSVPRWTEVSGGGYRSKRPAQLAVMTGSNSQLPYLR